MRYADPFRVQAEQTLERSRADIEQQRKRLRQVWVTTFAVHAKIERTQLLLNQIDKALLRFNSTR